MCIVTTNDFMFSKNGQEVEKIRFFKIPGYAGEIIHLETGAEGCSYLEKNGALQCAYSNPSWGVHFERCVRYMLGGTRCEKGPTGKHRHSKITRLMVESLALCWGLRVVTVRNPSLTAEQVWNKFAEYWPFKLEVNPRYMMGTLQYLFSCARAEGVSRRSKRVDSVEEYYGRGGWRSCLKLIESLRMEGGDFGYLKSPEYGKFVSLEKVGGQVL